MKEIFTSQVSDSIMYLCMHPELDFQTFYTIYSDSDFVDDKIKLFMMDEITGFEIYGDNRNKVCYKIITREYGKYEVLQEGNIFDKIIFETPIKRVPNTRMLLEITGNIGPVKVNYIMRKK